MESNLNLFLNYILKNSIDKEIGYIKVLNHINNEDFIAIIDKKQKESSLQIASLKKAFLKSKISTNSQILDSKVKLRKWLDPQSLLSFADDIKMINEVILAEDKCITDYYAVLRVKNLPEYLRGVLVGQKIEIEKNLLDLRLIWGNTNHNLF